MLLILYQTKSGSNVINKDLTNPVNVDITVRSDFDIINPQIRLSDVAGVNLRDFNYCHIPDLNRYYFITSFSALNADIIVFECECDVIETYKDDILLSNARFTRKIKSGDYMTTTLNYKIDADITTHESDKGFSGENTMIMTTIGSVV